MSLVSLEIVGIFKLTRISTLLFHSSQTNLDLKLLLATYAIRHMQKNTTLQDMSKFIQTKCHLFVVNVPMRPKLKENYSSISKTITMKLLKLYDENFWKN